jgi:branched-chain amino acid transport system substrate-binding protein
MSRDMDVQRRKLVLGGASAGLAMSFPGLLRAQSGSGDIKIAVLAELTGLMARTGTMLRVGAEMAVEDINKSGGIKALGGRKLALVVEDVGDNIERARSAAQRLVSQHPDVVAGTGAWLSSHTLAITEVTERAKLPWVTVAWADAVTQRGFRYIVDVSAPASKLVSESLTRLLELAEKSTGRRPKTIGLVYDNTAYSLAFIKPLKEGLLQKMQLEAVVDQVFTPGLSDATPLIQRVRTARPEFLLVNSSSVSDAKLLIEKLTEFGLGRGRIPVLAPGAMIGAPEMLKLLGEDKVEGIISLASNWESGKRKNVAADLARRAKEPWMNQDTLGTYGSVFLIKDALEKISSTDKEKLMEALRTTNTTTGAADYFVGGSLRFDETGRRMDAPVALFQWQKGRPTTVYPEAEAYAPLVWPRPQ